MSLPPESLPDHIESAPAPAPVQDEFHPVLQPVDFDSTALAGGAPVLPSFPAWKAWDVVAIIFFSIVIIIAFTVVALFVARTFPQYHNA